MRAPAWSAALVAFLVCMIPAIAGDRVYWVWQRAVPLTELEAAELRTQGVTKLFWHVATIVDGPPAPALVTDLSKMAPGFITIPVVRVETRGMPASEEFLKLGRFARDGVLQLDLDSPDRLLGMYAARLTELRTKVPHLGITALAHWPSVKDFPALASSVEELCPMFYDLQADPTDVSAKAPAPPLLDPEQVEQLLAGWSKCPTRWRAGLPVFSRLTVFDEQGVSKGQIPSWEWDEVAFNKQLRRLAPTRGGVTLMRAGAPTMIQRRPLREGDMLAVRTTDAAALAKCISLAESHGAVGTVLFRLPSAGSHATWSLRSLREDAAAKPEIVLRREGDAIVLGNSGGADLSPRLDGPRDDRDRGYELEIDAPAPFFREAEAGQFYRVNAHASPEREPRAVNVPLATRLTFWFSHLQAGATLRSGIFQLAPNADPARLRWRVTGGGWQPFVTP